MRLAILAALAAGALLAWLNVRDMLPSRRRSFDDIDDAIDWLTGGKGTLDDPMGDVQSDPWPGSYIDNPVLVRMREAYRGHPIGRT